jgi:hypothetical protein
LYIQHIKIAKDERKREPDDEAFWQDACFDKLVKSDFIALTSKTPGETGQSNRQRKPP